MLGGKVEQVPEEFDLISRVFREAGGSWAGIFNGAPKDMSLLKEVIKMAFKKQMLTVKRDWRGNGST